MTQIDSVFLGYASEQHQPIQERRVLMVRRNDELGSWYLPGGGHPDPGEAIRQSLARLLERQTSLRDVDVQYLAHWTLSNGSSVRLFRPTDELPHTIDLPLRYGDRYVRKIGWKTPADLVTQHQQGLTPWAQFKMAMFALDPTNYIAYNGQPKGDRFDDEFRTHDHAVWVHPKFR